MAENLTPKPALIIQGDDHLARSRVLGSWRAALGQDMADFNLDERDARDWEGPADLVGSLMQLPFGAPFRLVIVHDAQSLAKPLSEAIVDYLADPSGSTVLILDSERVAANTRLHKAVVKAGGKGAVETHETPKAWQMPARAQAMAREKGLTLDAPAAEELVSRVGTSTEMIDNTLVTLEALLGKGAHLGLGEVRATVARVVRPAAWEVVDAVSARDLPRALTLLRQMEEGDGVWILSMLVSRLRELIYAQDPRSDLSVQGLRATFGGSWWPRKVQDLRAWTRNFSAAELALDLGRAAACERVLKGTGDGSLALERLVEEVCRRSS